jgi:hypothetical protein
MEAKFIWQVGRQSVSPEITWKSEMLGLKP